MGMKLAVVLERVVPSRGGAETYVADLCRRLAGLGHRVDLYAASWDEQAIPLGVRCHAVAVSGHLRSQRIWSFATNAQQALATDAYDCSIGFINTWGQDVLIPQGGVHEASLVHNARRFPEGWRRTLYLAGKRLSPRHALYKAIEAKQYDPASGTRYVAVSQMVAQHLQHYHGVRPERITVIPNAIDARRLSTPEPLETRARFRYELGLNYGDLVGLFVAHNFRLKGLGKLLEALATRKRIYPRCRPIHLLICGGGKPAPYLKQIKQLGLERDVRMVGFLPDVAPAFHASDFFVLPSYYDPCSLVVFEALACGLPVITTACNGAGELITQGREGFVVPSPDDVTGLARALEEMTDHETRRLRSLACTHLGREQSFDKHLERLLALFELVASDKKRRSRLHVRADRGTPLIGAGRSDQEASESSRATPRPQPGSKEGEDQT